MDLHFTRGVQGPNEKLLTFGNAQDPGLFGRILYRSTLDHIFINTYRIELRKKMGDTVLMLSRKYHKTFCSHISFSDSFYA